MRDVNEPGQVNKTNLLMTLSMLRQLSMEALSSTGGHVALGQGPFSRAF